MIPILFPQAETAFTSNGIGRLPDIISCIVTEERNGIFECEFQYPITGHNYKEIREGRIIYCTYDDRQNPQPFDIYAHSAPIDGIVTYNARHISYRLRNYILKPSTFYSVYAFCSTYSSKCIAPCPFTLTNSGVIAYSFDFKNPISVREALGGTEGSILDKTHCVFEFDKYTVYIKTSRGNNMGVQLRYGKNLTDLTYELDDGDTYNAVVPYWNNPDGSGAVTLPEWQLVANTSSMFYTEQWTDDGGNFMTTEDTDEIFEFKVPIIKPVAVDLSSDFVEQPTEDQLRNLASSRLNTNKPYEPTENITVDFVHLWEMAEYEQYAELQKVKLDDTVTVVYEKLGVNVAAKVIKTVYDSIAERYTEIELGDPRSNFADTLTNVVSDVIRDEVVTPADVNVAIHEATQILEGGKGGYIRYVVEGGQTREILFMNTDDIKTAKYVLRINSAGIGFSSSGYRGPYTNAWTIDGHLNADWITTGRISSEDGSTFFDLVKGWLCTTYENITDPFEDSIMLQGGRMIFRRFSSILGMINSAHNADNTRKRLYIGAQGYTYSNKFGGISLGAYIPAGATEEYDEEKLRPAIRIFGNIEIDGTNYTEPIIFMKRIRVLNPIYFGTSDMYLSINTDHTRLLIGEGGLRVQGDVTAASFIQSSDERLKNIWQWDERYDTILDVIEPILFTWKTGLDTSAKHIGVSAQKLQAALSNAGITDSGMVTDVENQLAVNYNDINMLLLKRVQEQQRKIDSLEARLERLEALLNADS